MKRIILLLLVFVINSSYGEIPSQQQGISSATIEPLMPLSRDLSVTINAINRKNMHDETINEQLIKQNNEVFNQKTINWQLPLAILVIVIAYFIIKLSGIPLQAPSKTQSVSPDELLADTTQELATLKQTQEYNQYFQHIDHTVRAYFKEITQVNTFSSTTQELISIAAKTPDGSHHMEHLLQLTDNIKYAKYHPTFEECNKALEEAKRILHH